jgi:hypothetical protein
MDRWVPKVHPLSRPVEFDDPMELMANPVEGDPYVMLDCIVEEFAWMGYTTEEILALFDNPEYPVLNQLARFFGKEEVCRRVEERLSYGMVRFTEVIADDLGENGIAWPFTAREELIQLSFDRVRKG